MFKPLLIHNNNTPIKNICNSSLIFNISNFDFGRGDIDMYISKKFMPLLQDKDFNILFIKDNLSTNYLELYGVILAYHIRLSSELEGKRFVPIVILSDIDGYILNKLDPLSKILFTKNTFVSKNDQASFKYYEKAFNKITGFQDFKKEFTDLIQIDQPKDYLSHHDISNEWSIFRWSEFLNINSEAIQKNGIKIENMLYFKYLKALNSSNKFQEKKVKKVKGSGTILFIDDEWYKGWADILEKLFSNNQNIDFIVPKYKYLDENKFTIMSTVTEMIKNHEPDVVILDLRLSSTDHNENIDVNSFTGIKLLNAIHEINAGIQVIMLTATSKSTILEMLYNYKILGYVKKEHPNDISIDTISNINKLVALSEQGLNRKYLIEIYTIQKELLELDVISNTKLSLDGNNQMLELKNTLPTIFEILDSNIPRALIYGMLALYKCIEIINDYYIIEHYDHKDKKFKAYWKDTSKIIDSDGNTSVGNKTEFIFKELNINDNNLTSLLKQIVCSRNYAIHAGEITRNCENKVVKNPQKENIVEWFRMIKIIIQKINEKEYSK